MSDVSRSYSPRVPQQYHPRHTQNLQLHEADLFIIFHNADRSVIVWVKTSNKTTSLFTTSLLAECGF